MPQRGANCIKGNTHAPTSEAEIIRFEGPFKGNCELYLQISQEYKKNNPGKKLNLINNFFIYNGNKKVKNGSKVTFKYEKFIINEK